MPVKGWKKESPKQRKDYRFSARTIMQLEELQKISDKTETDIIEAAINYVQSEYVRAISGKDNDQWAIAQVLGIRV